MHLNKLLLDTTLYLGKATVRQEIFGDKNFRGFGDSLWPRNFIPQNLLFQSYLHTKEILQSRNYEIYLLKQFSVIHETFN